MRRIAGYCAIVGAFMLAPAGRLSAAAPNAVEQFQSLQQSLSHDRAQKDWRSYLADAGRMRTFLNDSPLSNLEVARAELQLGNIAEAAAATKRFLAMGQVNEILKTPAFAQIRPGFDDTMIANRRPVSRAQSAFVISDTALLPEDIDYDSTSRRFFVTSILRKKIVTMDASGGERDFAASPDHWPMVALKIDAKRRVLWATEVAFNGFAIVPKADWGRSVLLEYDLDRGTLLTRIEGPRNGNLGDMVLADGGDPVVSDGDGGGIYRVHDRRLDRIDHGDFVSPQTLAICRNSNTAFVPDYVRGTAMMNLATGSVRWLSTQGHYDLDGIDGLYCRGNLLIAAQNGASPERVISFALDGTSPAVVSQRVIERGSSLGDPTHGVFVGSEFYYIANSGWSSLDEHGVLNPSAALTPARIMRFDLSEQTSGEVE
jgi:hypothetical protein